MIVEGRGMPFCDWLGKANSLLVRKAQKGRTDELINMGEPSESSSNENVEISRFINVS